MAKKDDIIVKFKDHNYIQNKNSANRWVDDSRVYKGMMAVCHLHYPLSRPLPVYIETTHLHVPC